MIYTELSEIPYRKEQAIIINVGTRFVTTLALLSTIKRTGMEVLLVDCPIKNSNEDFDFFELLMNDYDFDLISMPLRNHGDTLDNIFKNLEVDYILLVDSDLEILDEDIITLMKRYINKPNVFGSGFVQGSLWLKRGKNWEEPRDGFYEERIWIPFTYLDVKKIRIALDNGQSFNIRLFYNLIPFHQALSRKILYSPKLNRISMIYNSEFKFLDFIKRTYQKHKPLIILYDTGSDIYTYLRYQKNYFFAGLDANTTIESEFVKHYSGITRRLLYNDPYNTGSIDEEYINICNKLINEYSFNYESFNVGFLKQFQHIN